MDYFTNLNDTIIKSNEVSLSHKDAVAWNNKKNKTYKEVLPRGKVVRKLMRQRTSKDLNKLLQDYEKASTIFHSLIG